MDFGNATKTREADCFHWITSETIPTPYNVLYKIALSIIVIFGDISNILLLYGSIRTTVKYNSTQKLFLVLSVSDLWTAVVALPIQIYIVNLVPNISCLASSIQVFTAYHTPWHSGLIICVICLTRYITVTTKQLKEFLDGKRFALAVSLNFLLALALAFWQAFSFYYKQSTSLSIYYFLAGSFALVLLTGVIVLNSRLINFLRKIKETRVTANSQYQVKVVKTVLIISTTTFICYTPMIIGWMVSGYLYLFDMDNIIIAQTFNSLSQVLVYLNCGIGPAIYMVSSGLLSRLWTNLSKKKGLANKISDPE